MKVHFSKLKRLLPALLLLSLSSTALFAQNNPSSPFGVPLGMGLISPARTDSSGQNLLYGGSSDGQPDNWSMSQSGSPQPDFPPLTYQSSTDEWVAGNGMSAFHWYPQRAGRAYSIAIAVNGQYLPCNDSYGNILEYDTLFGPNGWSNADNPTQYPSSIPSNLPTMDQLVTFYMSGTYTLVESRPTGNQGCLVNVIKPGIGVQAQNTFVTPHQLLLYDAGISYICGDASDSDYVACRSKQQNPQPGYFWTGAGGPGPHKDHFGNSIYGFDDFITSYGGVIIQDNDPHGINFDILTRLTQLITAGGNGMDTDISHWTIASVNFGQANWGSVYGVTSFQGFSPVITTKHN